MWPFPKRRSKEKQSDEISTSGFRARARGFFARAKFFFMYKPTMIDVTHQTPVIDISYEAQVDVTCQAPDENFMENFIRYAMPAAAYNSSARDPPPRCHPSTRLSTIGRTQSFVNASGDNKRLLWVVGPAGVGKSAIMQTIAETTPNLCASIFFSVNGADEDRRDDPSKIFTTIAFQIAVKHPSYREHIRQKIATNPALPKTSMATQFEEFIVKPFIDGEVCQESGPLLILLDGLDECCGIGAQCEILRHITCFTHEHPSAPLLWIIASRPEPHITSFFSRSTATTYVKEEITVDSNEGREGVERFLRNELEKIRAAYASLSDLPRWPEEHEFLKLAAAATGLFAYASTVIRFIGDPEYRNPAELLQLVLEVIDGVPFDHTSGENDPMAQLDALYERVLSRIPTRIFHSTQKLLFVSGIIPNGSDNQPSLFLASNWLGMTRQTTYAALDQLHSLLDIPLPPEAISRPIQLYHKSFQDYLLKRFPGIQRGAKGLEFECALRILREIPERLRGGRFVVQPPIIQSWTRGDLEAWRILHSKASTTIVNSNLTVSLLLEDNSRILHALKVIDVPAVWKHGFENILDDQSIYMALKKHGLLEEHPIQTDATMTQIGSLSTLQFWSICCRSKLDHDFMSQQFFTEAKECPVHPFSSPVERNGYFEWTKEGPFSNCDCGSYVQAVWMHARKHSPYVPVWIYHGYTDWIMCSLQDPKDTRVEWKFCLPQ